MFCELLSAASALCCACILTSLKTTSNFAVYTGKGVIMRNSILLSFALLSIAATQSVAETRWVPGDYSTIQQAIQGSNDGDVVIVEAGEDHHTRSSEDDPLVTAWYLMEK